MSTSLVLFFIILVGPIAIKITIAECQEQCGDVRVPFPFGLGGRQCAYQDAFELVCEKNPPILAFARNQRGVIIKNINVTTSTMSVILSTSVVCLDDKVEGNFSIDSFDIDPLFTISSENNKFVAIGCDFSASITSPDTQGFTSGCATSCDKKGTQLGFGCQGNGCCQTIVPEGLRTSSWRTLTRKTADQSCNQAYIVEKDFINFDQFSLTREAQQRYQTVPVSLAWVIGNVTCNRSGKINNYACKGDSKCMDTSNGYCCVCQNQHSGNPYVLGIEGCASDDLCSSTDTNPCDGLARCINLVDGSQGCKCPFLFDGDGKKKGSGCEFRFLLIIIVLAATQAAIMVYFLSLCIIQKQKKRNEAKLRNKNYKRNGGLLLEKKLSASPGQCTKYSLEDIRKITDDFNDKRITGKGGSGTVYKGILDDGELVAVKKSNAFDPKHIEDFTKEIVLLSEIRERNIVQLKGYCFYDQYPIIVYEFIDNGTLHDHLHDNDEDRPPLSWMERAQIANSVASAIAYLHKGAENKQVIHRDIKSKNVLLDWHRNAKLGDFGLCRTIAVGDSHGTTFNQSGTPGYIDPNMVCDFRPENDVYGYGVLLLEILTNQYPHTLDQAYRATFAERPMSDILDDSISHAGLEQLLQRIMDVAASCIQIANDRPNMRQVAGKMETIVREMELIQKQQRRASSSSFTYTDT